MYILKQHTLGLLQLILHFYTKSYIQTIEKLIITYIKIIMTRNEIIHEMLTNYEFWHFKNHCAPWIEVVLPTGRV